jgi:pyruvate,phosphate dikinase
MSRMDFPVPQGVVIPTSVCVDYLNDNDSVSLEGITKDILTFLEGLKEVTEGYIPLVSVRSGARVSMPGMMDTILNVGITSSNLDEWVGRIGDRCALDSYRRLIQMLGSVALGLDMDVFEELLSNVKSSAGILDDSEMGEQELTTLISMYKSYVLDKTGEEFPDTLEDQVRIAIQAVFDSWNNPRACEYRKMNGYSDSWGTAVVIQRMVFGNLGDDSATGVLFSRCPSTGAPNMVGEYLVNAQGEDVVAGVRTPQPISELSEWDASLYNELESICSSLEGMYKDMQDIEFTIEKGKIYILQTRKAKRSSLAAIRVGVDLLKAGVITLDEFKGRVSLDDIKSVMSPSIDSSFDTPPDYKGIAAGGAIVSGIAYYADSPVPSDGGDYILVSKETTPDDIVAMGNSLGILTQTGGLTSHAAVVARGMGKTCVVGCSSLPLESLLGKTVTIDGGTGNVWVDTCVPVITGGLPDVLLDFARDILEVGSQPIYATLPEVKATGIKEVILPIVDYDLLESDAACARIAYRILDLLKEGVEKVIIQIETEWWIYGSDFDLIRGDTSFRSADKVAVWLSKSLPDLLEPSVLEKVSIILNGAKLSGDLEWCSLEIIPSLSEVSDLIGNGKYVMVSDEGITKVFGNKTTYTDVVEGLLSIGKGATPVRSGVSVFGEILSMFS